MARRVKDVMIEEDGRDLGKMYRITEMPASQAEKWAARAFLALVRSGIGVPDDVAKSGIAGLAAFGLRAFGGISFADAEPLMDEMMGCVSYVVDPARPVFARALVETDIEEVATRAKLRGDVLELHLGFSVTGGSPT